MPPQALFWLLACGLVLGSLAVVLAPLWRGAGRAERRSRYDMAVHRDQLREIDSDRARGLISDDEAAATRAEIGRKLLAAASAAEAEGDGTPAPRRSRRAAPTLFAALALAAAAIYAAIGRPDLPDQPLALRQQQAAAARAARPSQAAAEAEVAAQAPPTAESDGTDAELVARLQEALRDRPNDLEGHRLLVRSLIGLQRWPEAEAAQGAVIGLLGDKATATDLVAWAELMIRAADGYVSPEAEAALGRTLAIEPENPLGRYYSGLTLLQGGRPDLAYDLWSRLLAEGPEDAPWMAPLRAVIGTVAAEAGLPQDGPTQADVDAAQAMPPAERQSMIAGMVDGLAARLDRDGGPADDWARLIRSLGVLGRTAEAGQAWARAQAAYAGDAAGLATLAAAARDAGLAR